MTQLLAFQRKGDEVWSDQWPFKPGSVNDDAHKDYAPALKALLKKNAHNSDHELDIVNYLLGYFGTQRAPRTFTTPIDEFCAVQQGYLAQQPTLTYHRANIRIDQVSSLQKRIAARMGLGGELFKSKPDLSNLPFYLVEHRALLPIKPNSQFDEEQTPESVEKEENSQTDRNYLVIKKAGIGINLKQGQVIDLILYEGEKKTKPLTLRGQMVVKIEGDKFWLDVGNSAQLEHNLKRVIAAAEKQLFWQNSAVWMEDMNYRLAYDSDQVLNGQKLPDNQKRLTRTAQTPFPAMIDKGYEITLTKDGLGQASSDESEKLRAKVVSFDRIKGTLIIESQDHSKFKLAFPESEEAWRYSWHFSGGKYEKTDHFSFVISVVVNRNLIEKLPGVDPYKLEEWVKETILTEFPAHISMIIHWMDQDTFLNFGHTYQHWQNNGAPLGDAAYSILESLTLGKLPSSLKGIGTMRIATSAQRTEQLGDDEKKWDTKKIIQDELFYVPKENENK
ncbi:hypothetical protein, partial [Xenorhabdus bovienii]|uniref:Uncharacterized protein n=1 Tax=Xenorhabdus bovienii str. kraussei Becker Underwood TaxID=1398204 RepID=A0A077PZ84_XENBV